MQTARRFVVAAALGLAVAAARADDTLAGFLKESSFSGNVRAYDFNRIYSDHTQAAQPSQSAFDLGGRLDVQTAAFLGGFSLGAGFFTAHSLGLNDRRDNLAHLDRSLAGSNTSLSALGQAYVQFRTGWITARAGDQAVSTPWMGGSDSRILPATYQGVLVDATPTEHLHLVGARMFRWKSRTSDDYFRNNLYYAPTYAGDDLRGGTATGLTRASTQGALSLGATYADHGFRTGLWYYAFQQFADMVYDDTVYTLKTGGGFDPFVGGQFVRQWKGDSLLNGAPVNTVKGAGVDNTTWGARAGLDSPYGQLSMAYTKIDRHRGAVGDGALVSPYTAGYASDPLDTTSMTRGLTEFGPGHAWKLRYTERFLADRIVFAASFARYNSYAYGHGNDTLVDVTYYPGTLKGFSIRNRVEDAVVGTPGNSRYFIYERLQLQYEF